MDLGNKEIIECFVIFTKSRSKHWLFKFIDSEIQHVYIMKKSEGGQFWTIINPLFSHTRIETVLVDDFIHPRCYTGDNAVIVPIKSIVDTEQQKWSFCIFNCVEVVKSFLGIKNFFILTPYQLYKRLKGR